MLNLTEEDADSFAKHAEMYYKKRPQLVNMIDSEDSEIDDPEEEIVTETKLRTTPDEGSNGHLVKLKQEPEIFKEENVKLKVEIAGKNEEKREVIRQLALSLDMLKEENVTLRKCLKDLERKSDFFELNKLTRDMFSGKLFRWKSKNQTTIPQDLSLCQGRRRLRHLFHLALRPSANSAEDTSIISTACCSSIYGKISLIALIPNDVGNPTGEMQFTLIPWLLSSAADNRTAVAAAAFDSE
ncbi:hypothetical protein ZIOFF_068131 [Zingiber officinale]|uniref:NAB domain-containing protein n=1 Tax=Zingiber officinale TaxID=94328 RepID=A0A8J5C7K0_ZINOF|nr:hypothetical protein ZIOFF_068131 [Zingiber officinale]